MGKIREQFGVVMATGIGIMSLLLVLNPTQIITDIPASRSRIEEKSQPKDTSKKEAPPPAESRPAAPAPAPGPPPVPVDAPSQVLDLTNWKLTLPVDTAHAGSPDEIKQPELTHFVLSPYFWRSGGGVVFRAHAGGATTSGSSYPRSELREMTAGGSQKASWSNAQGSHTMTITQAITHLPAVKPHVVAGQIHDASDDVVMIRLEHNRLFVEGSGNDLGALDPAYTPGTVFTVQITAQAGRIQVFYNGVLKVDYVRSGAGYYFKAGCYTQSNPARGDAPDAYGEVIIYGLQVSHS